MSPTDDPARVAFRRCLQAIDAIDHDEFRDAFKSCRQSSANRGLLAYKAAEAGQVPMMETLDSLGFVYDEPTLVAAAGKGHLEAVQWLLERKVEVNRDEKGLPKSLALEFAGKGGYLAVVKLLIDSGAQFDTSTLSAVNDEVREFLKSLSPKTPLERQREMDRIAARLPGEAEHLAAVVDNLHDHSLMLKYAEWLTSQKDPRGAFLKKFVAACTSTKDSNFPKPRKLPQNWLNLMGYQLVQDIIENDLVQQREAILRLARPVAYLNANKATDAELVVGTSKLGGLPDLPTDVAWPRGRDCTTSYQTDCESEEPCGFVGQINFADLVGTQVGRRLPGSGLLSIFAFFDFNTCEDGVRVLYHPNVEDLKRTTPPSELSEANQTQPTKALSFEEGLDLPWHNGPWADDLALPESHDYSELFRSYAPVLLGYFHGTTGGDVTPDKDWLHLLSVKPHVRFHLQIHKDDLEARNFDNVKVIWIDYD
ncbi:MAG: hypothetical protein JWM11_6805 [Planctomycetaceae bacterium]|nr:hypothetical protein [Planctomycetaceae bacterium]